MSVRLSIQSENRYRLYSTEEGNRTLILIGSMERPHGLAVMLKIVIQLLSAFKSFIEEYFDEAIGLASVHEDIS